jgi:phosphorylase kinase alpha/beta subunit
MIVIHHDEIGQRLKARYGVDDIDNLLAFLDARGALDFFPLPTGLYPAAGIDPKAASRSGYGNVWVRDNIYVALALRAAGRTKEASAAVKGLAAFFSRYHVRFEAIVEGRGDSKSPMSRPQVRFDGLSLLEIPARWAHAQNDALGYFLWMYCLLAREGSLAPDGDLLALFALYFEAVHYWEDEDSGHWEERRKIEASSIGAVVAGLIGLRELLAIGLSPPKAGGEAVNPAFLDTLISRGEEALASILPAECIQPDPRKYRRYDSALLFLIYPLDVVDGPMEETILEDVRLNLQGDYGIRRYLGDSYWTADYKEKLPAEELTADVSERQEERDALARPGEEAQWCIFDPIISIIFGRRYLRSGDLADLEGQVLHLNRSLGQMTGPECPQGELRCPEAYYLEHGRYVPNDHVPLLWTQANLRLALLAMRQSATRA